MFPYREIFATGLPSVGRTVLLFPERDTYSNESTE